jgi:hypothetical protein
MEFYDVTKDEIVRDIKGIIRKVEEYNKRVTPMSKHDYWCCNAYHYLHEALPVRKTKKRTKKSKGIK